MPFITNSVYSEYLVKPNSLRNNPLIFQSFIYNDLKYYVGQFFITVKFGFEENEESGGRLGTTQTALNSPFNTFLSASQLFLPLSDPQIVILHASLKWGMIQTENEGLSQVSVSLFPISVVPAVPHQKLEADVQH